ncbi:unnamed protein product [Aureobasidium mustum]|uniref:Uncharacterized protein n=1 Tax=Aureobasidium mustum TaxID=2773714 RepID=A0A9N8JYC3_9PEZI|nr:unnamed protein product [Aureobasidium mustum]
MSIAAQQTASSPMETTTEDVDMIASSVLPASNDDNSPSLATQCMAFQTRIDSVRTITYVLHP